MVTAGATDLAGRILAGRYRLLGAIGTGASGRVYLADDTSLGRQVAVKVLHSALADDAGFLRRFRAEARVAASLHHPNIMAVYDWGEDDGVVFMVLELLPGGSLRAMLDAGARLTLAQAAPIGRDVAHALEYAHRRGIVHRDIKPANLLFDEHGVVRIADFGLARALAEASWTEPVGAVFGTARYASPEQALGVQLDARSDLYSLALVLVEAVTGEVPFAADTTIGTLSARTQRPLVAPAEMGALAGVINEAGRIDADERYAHAAAMAADLAAAADMLGRGAPLHLPGLADTADRDPTRAGRPASSTRDTRAATPARDAAAVELFDQDEHDDSEPIEAQLVIEHDDDVAVLAPVATPLRPAEHDAGALAGNRVRERDARQARRAAARTARSDSTSEDGAQAKRRQRLVPLVVLVIALVTMALAAAGLAHLGGPGRRVPGLEGRLVADATHLASTSGLHVHVTGHVFADDPAGTIVHQAPSSGHYLHEGTTVDVVVSDGPALVRVPDVHGLTSSAALASLRHSRLVGRVIGQAYDEHVTAGFVVSQNPATGSVGPDSAVTLVVSRGPRPRTVPGLSGASWDAANQALVQLQLVGHRVDDYSETVPVGEVISTAPAGHATVPRGATVTVHISKGPKPIDVPNVVGMNVISASNLLRHDHLVVQVSGNFDPGAKVLRQSRPAHSQVAKGTLIILYI